MRSMTCFAYIILTFLLLAASCEKIELPEGTPAFVKNKILEIKSAPVRNPPSRVYEWEYNGVKYYYITAYCCDTWSDLYDANGTLVCHPDGGITGTGDGKCPDFTTGTLTKKIIWEDQRN